MLFEAHNLNKTKGFENRLESWLAQGYSLKEAKRKQSATQKSRSAKINEKRRGQPNIAPSQVGFWIDQGFSLAEAEQKVRENQARGLSFFQKKYGMDLGFQRWQQRQDTW